MRPGPYYGFGGMNGEVRDRARAFPNASCHECHTEHAAYDNVFMQFYSLLADAAPAGSPVLTRLAEIEEPEIEEPKIEEPKIEEQGAATTNVAADSSSAASRDDEEDERGEQQPELENSTLALGGLDPVLLSEGREELGKPEIVMVRGGYRYQFVSEPTRKRFEQYPDQFSIQNDSCLVVPGAPTQPDLFAVHEGRIYLFATPGCVQSFKADPEAYVSGGSSSD